MLNVNFWQDKIASKNIVKEKKLFEDLINSFESTSKRLDDLDELYESSNQENNQEIFKMKYLQILKT